MSLIRLSAPTVEPFGLAAAKTHLKLDYSDAATDAEIIGLVTVAREAAEDRLKATLVETSWRWTTDRLTPRMRLPMDPIMAVSEVKYTDTAGVLQTLAGTEWRLADGVLLPAFGKCWPAHAVEPGAVRITYTAGHGATAASVPTPIVQWIKLALTDLWINRGSSAERPAVPQGFAESLLENGHIRWSV